MKDSRPKTTASLGNSQQYVVGTGDSSHREHFDFHLHMHWIETVIDRLDNDLLLMARVFSGIHALEDAERQYKYYVEIEKQFRSDEIDKVIGKLEAIQRSCGFGDEITENYAHILDLIENLRKVIPVQKEILLPYFREPTQKEELQLIRDILVVRENLGNLRRKDETLQRAIEETKLETNMLEERSPREMKEMVDQSELDMIYCKLEGDRSFARLQEEVSGKVLDLDNCKDYQDLVKEHVQNRSKIAKLTVQLQLWIKQYDKFVGEPMKELEALEADVDQFPKWKETIYDPQELQFNELLFNVELLEAEVIEEQVEKFRIVHAARVIQRAWRKVLSRQTTKKKKRKKGKKGKRAKKKAL